MIFQKRSRCGGGVFLATQEKIPSLLLPEGSLFAGLTVKTSFFERRISFFEGEAFAKQMTEGGSRFA